jgi:5'-nucleotidase/UDP-sugar diphosphatase
MVNILRAEAKAAGEDSLFLHAGDEFTGTLWDYIYAREGNMVVAPFLNGLGLDAFVLGNHEFDYGPIVTSYFIGNITTPVISCNTDVSKEPVLAGMVKPFIVKKLPISGATVGIIGFTTPFTNVTSSPGPNVTFAQPADVAGKCIADAKAAGAEIIIALTHIGYDEDVALAKVAAAQGIDLIVGGHSHTLLYTGKVPDILVSPPTKETDVVAGPYPTESGSPNGKSIPVTQALWASRYMGYIRVNFTPGVGAAVLPSEPILLGDTNSTNYVHSDANVSAMIAGLKGPLDGLTKTIVGDTAVFLDGNRADIRNEETNFGNLVTDAHVWYITNKTKFLEQYPNTPLVGHFNGGGIRTSIPVGNVTRGQVATALPFGNTLVLKLVSAADLLAALNNGVSQWTGDSSAAGRFPQVSQMRFSFNSSAPASNRVIRVQILDKSKLIELSKYNGSILVVMNNYVAAGGDGSVETVLLLKLVNGVSQYEVAFKYDHAGTQPLRSPKSYLTRACLLTKLSPTTFKPFHQ